MGLIIIIAITADVFLNTYSVEGKEGNVLFNDALNHFIYGYTTGLHHRAFILMVYTIGRLYHQFTLVYTIGRLYHWFTP